MAKRGAPPPCTAGGPAEIRLAEGESRPHARPRRARRGMGQRPPPWLAEQPAPRRARSGERRLRDAQRDLQGHAIGAGSLTWQTCAGTASRSPRSQPRQLHVVFVRPELVVEIAFNGVQAKATTTPAATALRFARGLKGYRTGKTAAEADTVETDCARCRCQLCPVASSPQPRLEASVRRLLLLALCSCGAARRPAGGAGGLRRSPQRPRRRALVAPATRRFSGPHRLARARLGVVVTDGKGRHVTTLGRQTSRYLRRTAAAQVTAVGCVDNAEDLEDTLGPASSPPEALRPRDARRAMAIVVDDLRMSFESIYYSRRGLQRFLDRRVPARRSGDAR